MSIPQDRRGVCGPAAPPPILVHVTTVPSTFAFFRGQITFMQQRGFQIQAVSSPGLKLAQIGEREDIPTYGVEMARRITPGADLISLVKLYNLFRTIKPTIVHAHTPKGGLLGVLAARRARVPIVIYSMRGLPFVTQTGWRRRLLIRTEKMASRAAARVIAVSRATKAKAVAEGICPADKIVVLAHGSSNGVDAAGRFNPENLPGNVRAEVRERYGLPSEAVVVGFVGRLVRDKGLLELTAAWEALRERHANLYLLLVGPWEPQDPIPHEVVQRLERDPRVILPGPIGDMPPLYAAMDVLTLPTYREGFPNTPLEAQAMRLPVVVTEVDGCPEAIEPGVTGLLVPPYDSPALAAALDELVRHPDRRQAMGVAGRERVLTKFPPELIWQGLYDFYLELLREKYLA